MAVSKPKEAEHYLWIDGVSKEFEQLAPADMEDETFFRWWQLRLLLCIVQQTSVISQRLKDL